MLYTILAPIGFGINNILSKLSSQKIGAIKTIILQNVVSIFGLILLSYLLSNNLNTDKGWFLLTMLIGVFGYFGFLSFIKAITRGKIGIIIPIVDLVVVVSTIETYLFLGQRISNIGLVSMLVILLGAVSLSLNLKDLKSSHLFSFSSGVPFALIASFILGSEYFLRTFTIAKIGAINTSIAIELGVLMTALFHLYIINKEKIVFLYDVSIIKLGFLIGIFAIIGNIGLNLSIGIAGGPLTFALLGARPAVSSLVAYFYLGERLDRKSIICLVLIALGVVGVSLFR